MLEKYMKGVGLPLLHIHIEQLMENIMTLSMIKLEAKGLSLEETFFL